MYCSHQEKKKNNTSKNSYIPTRDIYLHNLPLIFIDITYERIVQCDVPALTKYFRWWLQMIEILNKWLQINRNVNTECSVLEPILWIVLVSKETESYNFIQVLLFVPGLPDWLLNFKGITFYIKTFNAIQQIISNLRVSKLQSQFSKNPFFISCNIFSLLYLLKFKHFKHVSLLGFYIPVFNIWRWKCKGIRSSYLEPLRRNSESQIIVLNI